MIYVSSSCLAGKRIDHVIEQLVRQGISAIELSGGTLPFTGLGERLEELQKQLDLDFLCHNYFPPPQKPFVFNLASLNEEIYQASLDHARQNIALSRRLGADRISFHAGFCLDVAVDQLGKKFSPASLPEHEEVLERFCTGVRHVQKDCEGLEFYLENNVFSADNKAAFQGNNPFLLTNFEDYLELRDRLDFKLLLDVAHLKVSCRSQNLQFEKQLQLLLPEADYLHISDNDGSCDANLGLSRGSSLWRLLKQADLRQKTITLEVYNGLDSLKSSLRLVEELVA